jgi:NTP pyrophosphatase (non-canonical NTP hydrolase)
MPFFDRARLNTLKWGVQPVPTLALCICEEAGEIARAILQAQHEGCACERATSNSRKG